MAPAISIAPGVAARASGVAARASGAAARVPVERPTAAGRVRAGGPVLHSRTCAVVTAVSCGAHLWWAAAGQHGLWLGVVMVALAAVCVPCAVHIWRHRRVRALHQVTLSALLMVVLHGALLFGAGGAGHAHGGRPASSAAQTSGSTQLLLVIGLELVTALLAATLVARLRHRSFCPGTPG